LRDAFVVAQENLDAAEAQSVANSTGAFVNPITAEEEAMTPGITARLDAYIDEVCAAVQ
jgi:hypothetical protein